MSVKTKDHSRAFVNLKPILISIGLALRLCFSSKFCPIVSSIYSAGLTNQSVSELNLSFSILTCKTSTETAYLIKKVM